MNLADLGGASPSGGKGAKPAAVALPLEERALVSQLGSEVAATLSSALERVHQLVATGRIDRIGLSALREEIDRARRAAITGQQVVRLAQGQVQMSVERLHLTTLVREALRQRGREIEARGIAVRQLLAPAEVLSDATLLFSLLQTLLDWCFEHTVSRLDLRLEVQGWPARARLLAGFFYRPVDEAQTLEVDADDPAQLGLPGLFQAQPSHHSPTKDGPGTPMATGSDTPSHAALLDTMSWRLLLQMASVLGLSVARQDRNGRTELQLEFPKTVAAQLSDPGADPADEALWGGLQTQPLARRQVLSIAYKRELRNVIREALRPTGALLDMVDDAAQAKSWCQNVLPHAVVYEEAAAGEALEALRHGLQNEAPGIAFLCIADQGRAFELLNVGGRQVASVGSAGVMESLAAALVFELSRQS